MAFSQLDERRRQIVTAFIQLDERHRQIVMTFIQLDEDFRLTPGRVPGSRTRRPEAV